MQLPFDRSRRIARSRLISHFVFLCMTRHTLFAPRRCCQVDVPRNISPPPSAEEGYGPEFVRFLLEETQDCTVVRQKGHTITVYRSVLKLD